MLEFLIDFLIFGACVELWKIGGDEKAWARDVIIPIILGTYLLFCKSIPVHYLWGALSIGSFNIIRIGYGIPDETDEGSFLGRIFKSPWLTRAVCGFLYSVVGGCMVFIVTQKWWAWALYTLINVVSNGICSAVNAHKEVHERLAGASVGSIVFLFSLF